MFQFQVLLNGKFFDEVVYEKRTNPNDVKRQLVEHEGYDRNIKIKAIPRGVSGNIRTTWVS